MGEGTFYAAKFTSIKLRSLEKVNLHYDDEFRSVDLNTFKIYVPQSLVETYKKDPLYGKRVKSSKKYAAHDEKNEAKIGDTVRIVETRPLSRTKHFRLVEVVEKAIIL